MNRRELLLGATAAAVAAALPGSNVIPFPPPAIDIAISDTTVSWVVGTDGEFNWHFIRATNANEAIADWVAEQCGMDACEFDDQSGECDCEYCTTFNQADATRMKRWDDRTHKNEPTPADWLRAGLGYVCQCGEQTSIDYGAKIVNEVVMCEECHERHQRDLSQASASPAKPEVAGVAPAQACGDGHAQGAARPFPIGLPAVWGP